MGNRNTLLISWYTRKVTHREPHIHFRRPFLLNRHRLRLKAYELQQRMLRYDSTR